MKRDIDTGKCGGVLINRLRERALRGSKVSNEEATVKRSMQ